MGYGGFSGIDMVGLITTGRVEFIFKFENER